jgi:predicted AAA+ superfamily ATPase
MESDKQKKSNLFWLTGSQHFHMMQEISKSLAGRVGIINLYGLSLLETKGLGKNVYRVDKSAHT